MAPSTTTTDAGRCAIITGASGGIGSAIAEKLSELGFRLLLTGRRESELQALAARLGQTQDVRVVVGDLKDAATIERLVRSALEAWNRVDVIVNNAGTAKQVPIERVTPELLLEEMQANTFGHAALIAKVWPVFLRQRRGVLVNISSLAAVDPLPGFFSYGASKAALESLARSAAREGAAHGIRAYNITPGAVATPLLTSLFGQATPQSAISPSVIADMVVDCIEGRATDATEGSLRVNE